MQAHTHTPAAIPTPLVHTHTHNPLHILTHTVVTPTHTPVALPAPPVHTHTHLSSFTRTTCAHPYTYLQISTNINSPQLSQSLFTNIYKYPYMLQISANIHTVIVHGLHPYELLGITIKIQSNRVDNKRI